MRCRGIAQRENFLDLRLQLVLTRQRHGIADILVRVSSATEYADILMLQERTIELDLTATMRTGCHKCTKLAETFERLGPGFGI